MYSITEVAYARIGFLGNPSDGYCGKSISLSLRNFSATVSLVTSPELVIVPHPIHDASNFRNLKGLYTSVCGTGYYGGARLLLATCKCFYEWCSRKNVNLEEKNFTLTYDTNIPRQVGLSGSSAIICAALRCLFKFYDVESSITKEQLPTLVLKAEQELGITGGLQDRVIQVYGGLVYMDFNDDYMTTHGHGVYTPLDIGLLPDNLYVMYAAEGSDSGKVHSPVKERWLAGDLTVRHLMEQIAICAEEGRHALETKDMGRLFQLINRNFDLRRQIFGDAALGATNLRMIDLARSQSCAAKFTGSGGAVLVMCPEGAEQVEKLAGLCKQEGFSFVKVEVATATAT